MDVFFQQDVDPGDDEINFGTESEVNIVLDNEGIADCPQSHTKCSDVIGCFRVTMLTREDWTLGTGTPPEIKGLVWYTDGSRMKEGTGAGVYGQSLKRRLSFSLGRYTTVFQAEIFAILACVYDIQSQNRPEKYISICSDSQAALKALQAVRTTSSLVHQCQKALNDISA